MLLLLLLLLLVAVAAVGVAVDAVVAAAACCCYSLLLFLNGVADAPATDSISLLAWLQNKNKSTCDRCYFLLVPKTTWE